MPETVTVGELTPEELEPALRQGLGIRAYLSGISRIGKKDVVQAGAIRLEIIDDDKTNERTIAFTPVPDLLSIELERRGNRFALLLPPDDATPLMEERYRGLLSRHETEVLKYSYPQLVQISEIDMAMRPIAEILIRVREYSEYLPRAAGKKGALRARATREARYASLLADLQFIQREGAGYVAGPQLPTSFSPDAPPEEVYDEFLGRVLQASHHFLTDVLHLTMITPFLRLENAYYWPAHQTGSKLHLRRDRLSKTYSEYYRQRPPKFETHLQSLVRKEALVSERGLVSGVDEILDPLLREDFSAWARAS